MTTILQARPTALLLLGSALLAAISLFATGTIGAQLTLGVDWKTPILNQELALPGDGTNTTAEVPLIQGRFYAFEVFGAAPDNTLTLTGAARVNIQNAAAVNQTDGFNVDVAAHKWRATFTGTATLVIDGAQDNVAGTFQVIVYEIEDDHAESRDGATMIPVNEVVDGIMIATADGVRDFDWFGFQGQQGRQYEVHLTATDIDNTLTIPARVGTKVFLGDGLADIGNGNPSRSVDFEAPSTATYYIEVRGSQSNVEGTYQIQVVQVGDAPAINVWANPGGWSAGVVGAVVEVVSGTATGAQVADAIEAASGRTVARIWILTSNAAWLLWAPGPINFGLNEFTGYSAVFPVLN